MKSDQIFLLKTYMQSLSEVVMQRSLLPSTFWLPGVDSIASQNWVHAHQSKLKPLLHILHNPSLDSSI